MLGAFFAAAEQAALQSLDSFVTAMTEAAPGLARPPHELRLHHVEGDATIHRLLDAYERGLERVCSQYDYRLLLYLSRLCLGLPLLRAAEGELLDAQRRGLTADLAALAYGARDRRDSVFELGGDGGIGFPTFSEDAAADIIELHTLASAHRGALDALRGLSYLRAYSKVNRTPPPEVWLDLDSGVRLYSMDRPVVEEQLYVRAQAEYSGDWSDLGWARLIGPRVTHPAVISMVPEEREPDDESVGSVMYRVEHRGLGTLYDLGCRYCGLFEENLGMPPEHLCAILGGLAQLNMKREGRTDRGDPELYATARFALTGLMAIPQRDIAGGALLEEATTALPLYYPESRSPQELAASLERFVSFASSSGNRDAVSLRRLRPTYLLHGEPHHEDWLVDYAASWQFVREVVRALEISHTTRGAADPKRHDADVRTSAFDRELAQYLADVEGVDLAFPDLRPDRDLPNVVFELPAGESQEVDVPLRVGAVLIAVQTMASPSDGDVDEGHADALERRWEAMRRKLKKTDGAYVRKLIGNPEGRRLLTERGFRHVLPVLCTPHPEPVVSSKPRTGYAG
jgi:hypothetical protein